MRSMRRSSIRTAYSGGLNCFNTLTATIAHHEATIVDVAFLHLFVGSVGTHVLHTELPLDGLRSCR